MARDRRSRYGPPLLVFLATAAIFVPVVEYPFVNWDDIEVFVRNDALRAPRLLAWAFSTRYMEHYQPLAWLTWGALERTVGITPASAHLLNVVLHACCAALVYVLVRTYASAWIAAAATMVWAIHPLRVEVVAWASAMPYSLALVFALLSVLAWLHGRAWTAVGLFGVSLLARPIALALPVVLMFLRPTETAASVRKLPSVSGPIVAAVGLAIAAALLESSARLTATLAEFGAGPRLTLAASAPGRYLWRTLVPLQLTPLDPLALTPRTDMVTIALGVSCIALVSAAAWRWRREQPLLAMSWLAYLALLVPAVGLVPSGLQATADRYTYIPAVALSIAVAATPHVRAKATARRPAFVIAGTLVFVFAILAWQQATYWRDSIALWTRAVDIDASNDVALYNLGTALDEAGRTQEARARYDQVLALVPHHVEARRNRDRLEARQLEDEGNRLASAGNLADAVIRYAEAVQLDPQRTHSHASLGMALTQLGRTREARVHLQTAIDQGVHDPAVANALAFGLVQAGDAAGAIAVLRAARRQFPNDPNVARNLAMLEK